MLRSMRKGSSVSNAPEPGEGQGGQDGQRMDETFVEDAQHQIDDQDGHDEQQPQSLHRGLKGLGGPLESWC